MEEKDLDPTTNTENEALETEGNVDNISSSNEKDLTETETVQLSETVLDDDELYAKIQTEKLLRKKKIRRISTFAGLCCAFVIAICVIVLAAVPVSLKPRCMVDGFASVALYPGTTNGVAFDQDDEGYKEFMKYYDKAFSQSYISAIFSGSLLSYDIEEKLESVTNVIGSSGELITNNTYFVRLRYAQEKVFTYQNGKVYNSNFYTSKWPSNKLTFTDVYFVVSQKDGFQRTEVYIVAKYPKMEDGVAVGTQEYLITLTVKANTNIIYDAWNDLTK